jgi:hypothetical protein
VTSPSSSAATNISRCCLREKYEKGRRKRGNLERERRKNRRSRGN